MDCKDFQKELPDLVLTPDATPSAAAVAHLRTCPPCTEDYVSFQQTFSALEQWQPVEPSPYFDQKLSARIREEQASPAISWFERLQTMLLLNTGRNFRPALAGALSLAMVLGLGGIVGLGHSTRPMQASATVNDLQILDRNTQAFEQMDLLQQEADTAPQPAETASPNSPVEPPS